MSIYDDEIESIDLCVPIYLNQQIVFDILAILEDGLSDVTDIKTSFTESEKKSCDIGTSAGLGSSILSLVSISFSGRLGSENGSEGQKEVSSKKVHTPSSLFAKLRINLKKKNLLKNILTFEDFKSLECSMFVEFRARLIKNPLVDNIEKIVQLMEMALVVTGEENENIPNKAINNRRSQKEPKNKIEHKNENKLKIEKFKDLSEELTKSSSVEIIGKVVDICEIKTVLSTNIQYFTDQKASELVDGEFRVLGKVIRIIDENSEDSINLLRKTSFGLLDAQLIEQFSDSFKGLGDHGIGISELTTKIEGPAIQVIPIAIFT